MPVGRTALCSERDIEEAVGLAWRLYPPQPYRRAPERMRATKATYGGCTLEEVAQHLGVTRQAVQQTEKRALEKCKRWCEERGLDLWDMLDQLR